MVKRKTHKKRRLGYKKRRLTRNKKHRLTRTIQRGGLSMGEIQTLSQDPYIQLYVNFIFNRDKFKEFMLNTELTQRVVETSNILEKIHTYTDIKKFKKEINYDNGWKDLILELIRNVNTIFPSDWWSRSNLVSQEEKSFLNDNYILTNSTKDVLNFISENKNKNKLIKPNSPPDLIRYYKIIYVRIILGIDTDFSIQWNEDISTIIHNAYYTREHTPPPPYHPSYSAYDDEPPAY